MTVEADLWRAMAGNPLRFLISRWPWRALGYLTGAVVTATVAWIVAVALLLCPPLLLLLGVPLGAVERRRLALLMPAPANPHATTRTGVAAGLRRLLREAATWRELGYAASLLSAWLLLDLTALALLLACALLLALPLLVAVLPGPIQIEVPGHVYDTVGQTLTISVLVGVPATIITVYAVAFLAGAQAEFAAWLLAPTDTERRRELDELTRSRGRLVDAFEAERRRIERDLHDGAQQHLVLLTMNLGLAEMELAGTEGRAGELVGEAHQQARLALAAIREQIRGIHPQILTDFGLVEAVRELADRCTVPVQVDIVLPGRLPPTVESTGYFVICEALTNVVRHAAATHVRVHGTLTDRHLLLEISDDGAGGATPDTGTGLRGLADRVAVMDGTLHLHSPVGGPTVLRIVLPCH